MSKSNGRVDKETLQRAEATAICGGRGKWWQRKGTKRSGFKYFTKEGKQIKDESQIERINSLVIPPAWKCVRISPSLRSRLQAVGVDTVGRVQYLYHAQFAARQKQKKFEKIERFGEHLPALRKLTNEHIQLEGFPRERVIAIMLRLINELYFRVGTEESVKRYRTYGITTLRNRHLEIKRGGRLIFGFVGKHHIAHRRVLVDEELATVMRDLKAIGGSRLFHYLDEEGKAKPIKPSDINAYIKSATSPEFSAKDFRTWGGTLQAAIELSELGKPEDEKQAKQNIVKAVKHVAEHLGNTPTVCRNSYIHPKVFDSYTKGLTLAELRPKAKRQIQRIEPEYQIEELALLKLLKTN